MAERIVEARHWLQPDGVRGGVVLAALLAYAIPYRSALQSNEAILAKQNQYPFISLEDRLPPPPKSNTAWIAANGSFLTKLESQIDEAGAAENLRRLRDLHEARVRSFVMSPGFGTIRMPLVYDLDWPDSVRQTGSPNYSESVGEPFPTGAGQQDLLDLHTNDLLDFLSPEGLGYFRSRREVAGFRSHRFKYPHDGKSGWVVQTVELVGVLYHDPPKVYVSPNLPRMDELSKSNTRPLDDFESLGLESLANGENLYLRSHNQNARMLGAIRNVNQCIDCHGGQRGELLGAFSYQLRKSP